VRLGSFVFFRFTRCVIIRRVNTSSLTPRSYLSLTIASGFLAVAGWAGLVFLITTAIPEALPRWSFFVLWLMALTGTALPFVRFLNQRFARGPVPAGVMLRQALWVGFFGATCAWLQMGRTLTVATTLLLAAGLGGVEWFLRMRESSRWLPATDADESA
jgi:hypothetical protein